jgi:hypothetical protein
MARVQIEHAVLRANTRVREVPRVGTPVSVATIARDVGFDLVREEPRLLLPRPRPGGTETGGPVPYRS